MQRSAQEKHLDEQELVTSRKRERSKFTAKPPPGRHSRFGGTFIMRNVKSISDNDLICHQPLERAIAMDFDRDKNQRKQSHRVVKEEASTERRSALSIRYVYPKENMKNESEQNHWRRRKNVHSIFIWNEKIKLFVCCCWRWHNSVPIICIICLVLLKPNVNRALFFHSPSLTPTTERAGVWLQLRTTQNEFVKAKRKKRNECKVLVMKVNAIGLANNARMHFSKSSIFHFSFSTLVFMFHSLDGFLFHVRIFLSFLFHFPSSVKLSVGCRSFIFWFCFTILFFSVLFFFIFSIWTYRLFLREFAIEILRSAFNTLVRQVRRTLERNSSGHDDSYLLWAIRFFLEFNRLSGFQLPLVR